MPQPPPSALPPSGPPPTPGGRSVFWRVAGILVGVQVATGLLAVLLSAWFAYGHSLDLVTNSLRLRLDGVAEEVERSGVPLDEGLANIPRWLLRDLANRFPDPVLVVDTTGWPLALLPPGASLLDEEEGVRLDSAAAAALVLPLTLGEHLAEGEVMIALEGAGLSWGLAPVYDSFGLLAGGLLVYPLGASIDRELAGTREAFLRAMGVTVALAVLIAILLGGFFTRALVGPLRRMTRQVERLRSGDYTTRIDPMGDNEFGRLAAALNQMAAEVQGSIEALQATDRLRRELIANIGHDLRTPLAALLGYMEEAERHLNDRNRRAFVAALEAARKQGNYLKGLIGDLFELSQLDSAQAPLRHEPIPIAELLADAVRGHRRAYQKAGIALDVKLESGLPVISADGVRLLRLFDNLLSNARRHTQAGGQVVLSAQAAHGRLYVQVEDTGEGMTAEDLESIFERYYQGQEARTRGHKGTGLGLPISRAIARAHGGDLTVHSKPGVGSRFTLMLPLATDVPSP